MAEKKLKIAIDVVSYGREGDAAIYLKSKIRTKHKKSKNQYTHLLTILSTIDSNFKDKDCKQVRKDSPNNYF